eukprot:30779-Pelagococcus_subviridis.AAC.5
MYPPTLSNATPRCAMRSCNACSPMANSGRHSLQICGFLRSVPSPLHGTSHMIRSKLPSGYRPPSSRVANGASGAEPGAPFAFAFAIAFAIASRPRPGVVPPATVVSGTLPFGNHCAWWFVTISACVAAPSAAHRLTKK